MYSICLETFVSLVCVYEVCGWVVTLLLGYGRNNGCEIHVFVLTDLPL